MSGFTSYKDAGVDVAEGQRAVALMKRAVRSTYTDGVIGDIGSFGGIFKLGNYKKPCLVSGTDGVGTKLKIAFAMDRHDTVGIDLVAMSVNDILCQGAKPLFFLDYVATGKLTAEKVAEIVSGVAEGCRQSGMALLGGETAEMAGFYSEGEYDLAGFAVGVVEEDEIIDGSKVKEGDLIFGLPSSGVHSNGYSLVRRLIPEEEFSVYDETLGCTIGEALLTPTRIYVEAVSKMPREAISGIVHVTGGGFYENIPRCIPKNLGASIQKGSWTIPPIFALLEGRGVETDEMYRTFNMGIGLMVVVAKEKADLWKAAMKQAGEAYYEVGSVKTLDDLKRSGLTDGERVLLEKERF